MAFIGYGARIPLDAKGPPVPVEACVPDDGLAVTKELDMLMEDLVFPSIMSCGHTSHINCLPAMMSGQRRAYILSGRRTCVLVDLQGE